MRSSIGYAPILLIAMTFFSCSGSGGGGGGGGAGAAPILKNLAVAFAAYNAATGKAGDFIFDASRNKVFDEFGAVVDDAEGNPTTLPTFEYKIDPDAVVASPMDGIVSQVGYQEENQDYSIILLAESDSKIFVNLDHVKNVAVAEGDSVAAGDQIGTAGTWDAPFGRTELMVGSGQTYYCPFDFFDPALKSEYEAKVTQLMSDWEAFKGDDSIYDQAGMYAPGCNSSTLTD